MAKLNDLILAKKFQEISYDFDLQELIKDVEENPNNISCKEQLRISIEILIGRLNNYEFALFLSNFNLGE